MSKHLLNMPVDTRKPNRRWTADERRELIVEAAIAEFAEGGLNGASTEAIARRAGISHAYLFRLFKTKRELFLAAVDRSYDRILEVFEDAAREHAAAAAAQDRRVHPTDPLEASVGYAYMGLVKDRKELMFQLHVYAAAAGDAEIRACARRRYSEVYRWVLRRTGMSADRARLFMAQGMLINLAAALELPELDDHGRWEGRIGPLVSAALD